MLFGTENGTLCRSPAAPARGLNGLGEEYERQRRIKYNEIPHSLKSYLVKSRLLIRLILSMATPSRA